MDNPQNVISFCTGYGGLELGIGRAGVDVRIVCNVEIEAFVQANLVAKIEEGRMADAPIWTDLKTFPAHLFRDCVDIITGGIQLTRLHLRDQVGNGEGFDLHISDDPMVDSSKVKSSFNATVSGTKANDVCGLVSL